MRSRFDFTEKLDKNDDWSSKMCAIVLSPVDLLLDRFWLNDVGRFHCPVYSSVPVVSPLEIKFGSQTHWN